VKSRLGLKVLGLSALVLGLMAFASSAAQAEVNAKWAILKANGELITISPVDGLKGRGDELLPEVNIKEIEVLAGTGVKEAILLTKVAGVETAILCTAAELKDAAGTGRPKLLLEGTILGKVTFTGCITKLKGVTSAPCKPHAPAASPEGTITTELAKGLIVLHELVGGVKHTVFLIKPDSGETFVTLTLGKAGVENECVIGEKLPISGKLTLEDCNNKFQVEEVEHLIKEFAALTDLWVLNKTAEHKATIDGSAWAKLVGAGHEGLKWAGLPG